MANEPVTMEMVDAVSTPKPAIVGMAPEFAALLDNAVAVTEYVDSVPLVDKERLIGIPFVVTGFAYNEGVGKDAMYVFVKAMLPNGAYIGFNDGGVGIEPVLQAATQEGENVKAPEQVLYDENGNEVQERMVTLAHPMMCPRGLRKSEYKNADGIEGTTYYFA